MALRSADVECAKAGTEGDDADLEVARMTAKAESGDALRVFGGSSIGCRPAAGARQRRTGLGLSIVDSWWRPMAERSP